MAKTFTLILSGESVTVDEPVFGTIDAMLEVIEGLPEVRTRKAMSNASVKIAALMIGKTEEEVRNSHVSLQELTEIMSRVLEFCGMEEAKGESSGELPAIAA